MFYSTLSLGKLGHMVEVISNITYDSRERDERLVKRYPLTTEGDKEYLQVSLTCIG